jgi:hypothetical protein
LLHSSAWLYLIRRLTKADPSTTAGESRRNQISQQFTSNGAQFKTSPALAAAGIEDTRRPTIATDVRRIQGQVLLAQGHLEEAGAALRRARADAETPNADRMTWLILNILWSRRTVWKSLFALSQLEARRGNHSAAQALLQEAREFVIGLASRSGSPKLHEAFLSLPDVQVVLG